MQLPGVIADVLADKRLQTLLTLIVLDVLLGIAAALRDGAFRWSEVGRFYQTTVLPVFLGYFAVRLTLPYLSAELLGPDGSWLTETVATGLWLAGVGSLLASVAGSVKKLVGGIRGRN